MKIVPELEIDLKSKSAHVGAFLVIVCLAVECFVACCTFLCFFKKTIRFEHKFVKISLHYMPLIVFD